MNFKMKKGFTLIELLVVITIIGILSNIGLNSFTSSQKKARDTKRKAHLRQMADAFEAYYNDMGQYPGNSGDGNIIGCGDEGEQLCTYDDSAFQNTTTGTVYMIKLPGDPSQGSSYYYDTIVESGLNTKFQLYARLENTLDIDVPKDGDDNPQVYDVSCGTTQCNYGISSSNVLPITDRSLTTE